MQRHKFGVVIFRLVESKEINREGSKSTKEARARRGIINKQTFHKVHAITVQVIAGSQVINTMVRIVISQALAQRDVSRFRDFVNTTTAPIFVLL